ncbi:hypothetical protein B0A50_02966 [Salinomyces thailandicus]|uniref:C2H2-type domain-containing protein n=1 Tax=Salinomyces thailandicus TaxID=706561 RepID=A0A4V5N4P9_9PEZI|nr:hypothetical protein B0A50_02966 [Salinomyces thailandica]
MDGRNCSGRTISLLNDSCDAKTSRLPSHAAKILIAPSHTSSSCASTPSPSPQTPPELTRSASYGCSFDSPSPITPSSLSDPIASAHSYRAQPAAHYYALPHRMFPKMDEQHGSMYPPIPDATGAMTSAYPMPPQMPPQQQLVPQPLPPQYRTSTSPASEPSRVSNVSASSAAKAQPKKNHYPCPMAKQVGCTDFFTTSGHAARHAKKHTGKKDAFCPECNKAFTRKDNMEQHRRTHQNGRTGRSSDENKVKKSTKPAPRKNVRSDSQLEAAVEQQLADQPQQPAALEAQSAQPQPVLQPSQQPLVDQALMMQPSGLPYFLGSTVDTGPVPALPMAMPELNGVRPPLQRSNFQNSLEYMPNLNTAQATFSDPDSLHYTYPSPGLSNGLDSLALAASEHQRRLSEEKASRSPHSDALSD